MRPPVRVVEPLPRLRVRLAEDLGNPVRDRRGALARVSPEASGHRQDLLQSGPSHRRGHGAGMSREKLLKGLIDTPQLPLGDSDPDCPIDGRG